MFYDLTVDSLTSIPLLLSLLFVVNQRLPLSEWLIEVLLLILLLLVIIFVFGIAPIAWRVSTNQRKKNDVSIFKALADIAASGAPILDPKYKRIAGWLRLPLAVAFYIGLLAALSLMHFPPLNSIK